MKQFKNRNLNVQFDFDLFGPNIETYLNNSQKTWLTLVEAYQNDANVIFFLFNLFI